MTPAANPGRIAAALTPRALGGYYAVLGLIAVTMMTFLMPPFLNPDETTHFLRADQVSRLTLVGERLGPRDAGGVVDQGILAAMIPWLPVLQDVHVKADPEMIRRSAAVRWTTATEHAGFPNTAVYPPLLYAPSAIMIRIGRAADLSVVNTLYLARLTNGLLGVTICAIAIAIAGPASPWILITLSLPLMFAQMASPSQDGLMLPLAALMAALLHRTMRTTGTMTPTGFALTWSCLTAIAAARPTYLLLAPLLLLPSRPGRWIRGCSVLALVLITLAWVAVANEHAVVNFRLDVPPGRLPDAAAQLRECLESPLHFARVLVRTFRISAGNLLGKQVIGVLGHLNVILPTWFYISTWLVLLWAACLSLEATAGPRQRYMTALIVELCVLLSAISIFFIQYLVWTPVGKDFIDGVQGRYFLPLLMLAIGIIPLRGRPITPTLRLAALTPILIAPPVTVIVTAQAVLTRYYN